MVGPILLQPSELRLDTPGHIDKVSTPALRSELPPFTGVPIVLGLENFTKCLYLSASGIPMLVEGKYSWLKCQI